ncbi:MAG: SMI1/KNR4 family protein, partial [Flavobacteriaceae bacterium]|nr:SMI1/KNR4 family protein [Flavobacteriaceae bacterium]
DDYFNFLAQNDGATIDEAYFYVKDIEEYIMFELFYDIEECIETYEEFSDDFPDKSLVIGRDPGGGMLLLVTEDVGNFSKGIHFYDHSHFFEASNSDCNTYFVCDTFSEFITILEHTTLP